MPDLDHGLVEAILHAVTKVAGELVASSIDAMPKPQRILADTIGADRILLIEHRARPGGGILAVVRNSWEAPGISTEATPQFFAKFSPDVPEIAEWFAPLKIGRPVEASRHNASGKVREILKVRNVGSMLLMPIMTHGELWGGFGIESKEARIWEKRAIDAFKTMADLIGAAITRERSLRESEERLQTVFNFVSDGIFVVEPGSGKFIDANPAGAEMFGYHKDEIIGKNMMELSSGLHPYTKETAGEIIGKAIKGQPQTFEWQCRAKDGRLFWAELSIKGAAFGKREVLLSTVRDITKRKAAQEQVVHLAYHDVLTGLANRSVFVETLKKAIARGRRNNLPFAVLYLDLDHFKDVNDTLGHPIGDLLLQSVSQRLLASARESDTVARFGGDEFAVLTTEIHEAEDAAVLADRLLAQLCEPFTIRGRTIHSGASIGIAVYGADAPDAESLLSHSDVALYRAKAEGRGTYRFFTNEMDKDVRRRVKLSAELRKAINSGQLFLVYQPQVALDTGRISGLEALVRWRHPQTGVMNPAEFVPIAESSGVVLQLGRWVMREACRQMKLWVDSGIAPGVIAVNISCLQFKIPRDLASDVGVTLAETKLPPQYLELELTETALMDVSLEHNDVLEEFHQRGIRLAIDDFGTGYSSLDYLHRYPVDRLKIAQVFVTDLLAGRGAAAIVKAAIGLAQELNINVIAEGIETEEQADLLRGWGCREGQGFHFSKPLLVEEVEPMLRCCADTKSPMPSRAAKWRSIPRNPAALACGPGMVLRCGLSGIPHPCEPDRNKVIAALRFGRARASEHPARPTLAAKRQNGATGRDGAALLPGCGNSATILGDGLARRLANADVRIESYQELPASGEIQPDQGAAKRVFT